VFELHSSRSAYWVFVPDAYDSSNRTPIELFVWMHGCGGEGAGDIYTVSPGGNQPYISISVGGREDQCWNPNTDQGIVLAAISDIESHFNIDPRRVVLGGYSSGGDLSYRLAFYHSQLFAGVLAENTSPFRDTGSTEAQSVAAASWKFHIVHLAHLQDETYPIAGVRNEVDEVKADGFPITLIERPGTHYDNSTSTFGTDHDLQTLLLPYLRKGWRSPAPSSSGSGRMVRVSGAKLIGVNGKPLRLIGVDRSGTEYSCSGPVAGGGFGYGIFQGPVDAGSVSALLSWHVNAVALPLNEACWLGGYAKLNPQYSGAAYRRAIVAYVNRLNRSGIYVILRLSAAAPGQHAYGEDQISSDEIPMADADHSVAFWRSVAKTFRSNHWVLFHTYDEPHDVSWKCLLHGCLANDKPEGHERFGTYRTAGNQAMVNAIRGAGARQPIIISGPNFAGDLSQWKRYAPADPRHELMADVSSFDYSDYVVSHATSLQSFVRSHPVIVGGFGDTHCESTYSQKLMRIMDGLKQSYLAWTWNTVQDYGGCSNALLDDPRTINGFPAGYYSGRPSGYGKGVEAHFQAIR
jgi:hypothetical protein